MASILSTVFLSALLASARPTVLENRNYQNGSAGDALVPTSPNYIPFNASNVPLLPPPVVAGATCTKIMIPVTVSSVNQHISAIQLPLTNRDVTAFVTEFLTTGSTLGSNFSSGAVTVNATYQIAATHCIPNTPNPKINQNGGGSTVQFLIHGIGFDQSYWDFPINPTTGASPNTDSYVQVATRAGYSTLAIDRLGCGASSHPDPIQNIQTPVFVEIVHEINGMLKAGKIGNTTYARVVNVGHSYGAIITNALNVKYPDSSDGSVLTGFTFNFSFLAVTLAYWNLQVASTVATAASILSIPADVATGYWATSTISSNEFAFYKYPNYLESVLELSEATKQPVAIGTLLTLVQGTGVATKFTGPVLTVTGDNDIIFCGGSCKAQKLLEKVADNYPANNGASSVIYLDGTGHGNNLHKGAEVGFQKMQDWFQSNGF